MKIILKNIVAHLVELLSKGDYCEVETLTSGIRLPKDQIEAAIEQYGRTLAFPPEEAFDLMDIVEIRDAFPPAWSVTMPLWTVEEGRSDLSLELTIINEPSGPRIELDDIHVL